MKEHVMPLFVQDLRGSTIRKRALRMRRPELWLLYQELLWALYEARGELSADPVALSDEIEFFEAEQIAELLPLLAPSPGKKGGIVVEDGRVRNPRMDEIAEEERAYRASKSVAGKRSAEVRKERSGSAKPPGSVRKTRTAPEQRSNTSSTPPEPPSPSPTPSPSPVPAPVPTPLRRERASVARGGPGGGRTATPARPPARATAVEIDHDHGDADQVELAAACSELAELDGTVTPLDVLRSVSTTPDGSYLDGLRFASPEWIAVSLRIAKSEEFRTELLAQRAPPE